MLVPIKTSGNKPPIYIIHGHGLNVLHLKQLADHLDAKQPLLAIQAMGLVGIEKPLDTIPEIAKCYLDEIKKYDNSAPLILAGYSSGGIIAYEMRRQLEAIGKKVKTFIIFDGSAEILAGNKRYKENKLKLKLLKILWMSKHPIIAIRNKISLRNKNHFFASSEAGYYQQLIRLGEKYDNAFENYQLTPSSNVIHLFRSNKRKYFEIDSKFLGWKKYTGNEIKVYSVPGDHDTMLKQPHIREFAKTLQNLLDNC